MNNEQTTYRGNRSNALAGVGILVLLFFAITLPSYISGDLFTQRQVVGQGIFWFLGIALVLVPLTSKFVVGKDYIKTYLFGICIDTLRASDIETIKYGKVKRWGVVGMGNGLMGWKKTSRGGRSYFSFSESGFGKEAIMDAKRALENK